MKQRLARTTRHECRLCRQRHARFEYRGVVKWDRFHELCFRCYRAVVNAQRARRLTAAAPLEGAPVHERLDVVPLQPFYAGIA